MFISNGYMSCQVSPCKNTLTGWFEVIFRVPAKVAISRAGLAGAQFMTVTQTPGLASAVTALSVLRESLQRRAVRVTSIAGDGVVAVLARITHHCCNGKVIHGLF